jgi:hypothetical protein
MGAALLRVAPAPSGEGALPSPAMPHEKCYRKREMSQNENVTQKIFQKFEKNLARFKILW